MRLGVAWAGCCTRSPMRRSEAQFQFLLLQVSPRAHLGPVSCTPLPTATAPQPTSIASPLFPLDCCIVPRTLTSGAFPANPLEVPSLRSI